MVPGNLFATGCSKSDRWLNKKALSLNLKAVTSEQKALTSEQKDLIYTALKVHPAFPDGLLV